MGRHEITGVQKIIDEISTNTADVYTFSFDNSTEQIIVPDELTHNNLLRNFTIDENILEYYCLPCKFLMSDEYWTRFSKNYLGNRETALLPYLIRIGGAYYTRHDLVFKLTGLKNRLHKTKINGKPINKFSELKPYFDEYAKGFKNGFDEFENSQISLHLTRFADKSDYANIVFERITKKSNLFGGWLGGVTGFRCKCNIKNFSNRKKFDECEIINAFEDGQKQGYYYRAWCIVFSNNNLFAPLFHKPLQAMKAAPKKTENKNEPKTLSDFFADTEKYNVIMNLLVTQGFCQANTFVWKDEKKTNKATVISVIKYLHKQGYYKNNKKPKTEEIQSIAQKTFGVEISISSIKQHKTDENAVKFIPVCS